MDIFNQQALVYFPSGSAEELKKKGFISAILTKP